MSEKAASSYVGRFAPSPTGPLHMGSLVCALASFLDARAKQGHWLVRIEDIDPPREQPGASHQILNSLRAHGLNWDGQVRWQSEHIEDYRVVARELLAAGKAFHCNCSRARLRQLGGIYDGHCRHLDIPAGDSAIRLRVNPTDQFSIEDRIQQTDRWTGDNIGDFVIWRRDNLPAYQLAVVVDDADQGITDIVRGFDLHDSSPRQLALQQALSLPTPRYAHIPVLINAEGQKLSKQTHAPALENSEALDNLRLALNYLGQPTADANSSEQTLEAAISQWDIARIPFRPDIPESDLS